MTVWTPRLTPDEMQTLLPHVRELAGQKLADPQIADRLSHLVGRPLTARQISRVRHLHDIASPVESRHNHHSHLVNILSAVADGLVTLGDDYEYRDYGFAGPEPRQCSTAVYELEELGHVHLAADGSPTITAAGRTWLDKAGRMAS